MAASPCPRSSPLDPPGRTGCSTDLAIEQGTVRPGLTPSAQACHQRHVPARPRETTHGNSRRPRKCLLCWWWEPLRRTQLFSQPRGPCWWMRGHVLPVATRWIEAKTHVPQCRGGRSPPGSGRACTTVSSCVALVRLVYNVPWRPRFSGRSAGSTTTTPSNSSPRARLGSST